MVAHVWMECHLKSLQGRIITLKTPITIIYLKSYSFMLASTAVVGAPQDTQGHMAMNWPYCSERLSKFLLWTRIFTHTQN